MAADIEITVRLKTIQGKLQAVPEIPPSGVMMKGKTVHYSNDEGLPVTILFVTADGRLDGPSPFARAEVTNDDINTLINTGTFRCGCRVRTKNGDVGWSPGDKDSPSGGVHDVGPH